MVRRPEDYRYSSYQADVRKKGDGLLTLKLIFGLLSSRDSDSGVEYRVFVYVRKIEDQMSRVRG
ncbi:MAG: hypothetical protein C4581_00580 [Nitrospiraceae bacterium]|nr:MAG: hypothetical protein C4581_00580 [Nitrospiraceae bacterium]